MPSDGEQQWIRETRPTPHEAYVTSDAERDNKQVNTNMQAVTSLSTKRKQADETEEADGMLGEGLSEGMTVAETGMTSRIPRESLSGSGRVLVSMTTTLNQEELPTSSRNYPNEKDLKLPARLGKPYN